jgi:microcystin-dependent protein
MAEPFLSEVRIMSFVFAPKGWALCNGQLLPINQNQAALLAPGHYVRW